LVATEAASRDAGLVRGIGFWAFTANIVNGVVGAGIFTLPATVALEAGSAAPLAYLVCAVVMAGVVVCFAEAGSRVPTSGGAYGTVEAAFGPATGFVVGALLLTSDVLASGGIAALLADTLGTLLPGVAGGVGRAAVVLAIFAVLAAANLMRVGTTARLISAATAIKLLPLLFFLALGVASFGHPAPAGPPPAPMGLDGFGRALILTLFAMCGMETPLSASGEVRNANSTLPRALITAMLGVVVLYMGVQLTAQHLLGAGLAQSAAPLADAAGRVGPSARAIMLAGAGVSAMAWLASDVLGSSRLLFAFGRDGRLPAWFGRLSARAQVPARAVVVYVAAAAALAITGSFLELVTLSALAVVGIYGLSCAAALVLQRRGTALAGPPLSLRATPLAAGIGLAGMAAMLVSARWPELLGLAAVVAGSLVWFRLSVRPGAPAHRQGG
jgi:amino acid transporter